MTECIQTCKAQERNICLVQGGSQNRSFLAMGQFSVFIRGQIKLVGLVTKAPRKPYENRTKTVKAPYRESYLNLNKPPTKTVIFLLEKLIFPFKIYGFRGVFLKVLMGFLIGFPI